MNRREIITRLGCAAALATASWPLAARAQQPATPVIGFLHLAKPDAYTHALAGLRRGLKEAGYVESRNVAIEYRWANDQFDRLPALAADLVHRQVAVIVAGGGATPALAAKAATSKIPIVVPFGSDPVKLGLITSLNRPGGNVTGVTFITTELSSKRLDLLRELVPQAMTVAHLVDPRGPTVDQQTRDMLAAARALGRNVIVVEARSDRDLETAFANLVKRKAGALVVGGFPFFSSNRDKVLALAARHSIPTIYPWREFAAAGGLMSYGADSVDAFRQGGAYAGRILNGSKPADLPFMQSTKFELVINMKTAKALGLSVPLTLQASADEVIE